MAEHFRARWTVVNASLESGADVAKERAWYFLAPDTPTCLRGARRLYTTERAIKFANASVSEIVELCWAWFDPFQIYAYNKDIDLDECGDQLEQLVSAEYVAMTWNFFEPRPEYSDWDLSTPFSIENIGCYASPVLCPLTPESDAYEFIALSDYGAYLRVCKSVSEPFGKAERVRAMTEIEEQFFCNAAAEGADPKDFKVYFRRSDHSGALIEADIIGNAGGGAKKRAFKKEILMMLKDDLKSNGSAHLVRPPRSSSIRTWPKP